MKLTQELLKQLFHYDPETGLFTWLVSTNFRIQPGDIAGGEVCDGAGKRYISLSICGKYYKAHRLAFLYMTGAMPKQFVDHINGDGTDNRWCNLREVDRTGNALNKRRYKSNRTGITGVSFHKGIGLYTAYIAVGGKRKHLGATADFFEACCLRKSAEHRFGYHPNHGRRAA